MAPSSGSWLGYGFLLEMKPSSAVYVRGVTKCVPLNVDRKLYKCGLIRQVDHREAQLHLYGRRGKVVIAHAGVEQVRGFSARGIVIDDRTSRPAMLISFAPLVVGSCRRWFPRAYRKSCVREAECMTHRHRRRKAPTAVC